MLLGLGSQAVAGDYAPFPSPDEGYVTDLAGLLSNAQEEQIEQWLYQAEKSKGIEIIVVTIRSIKDYPGTPNTTIEEFARALFDKYGIGNMPANDGVLLLVAHKDRKARIELGAHYKHQRDADARRIMNRKIIPCFRRDEYDEGITEGVKALIGGFGGMTILPGWLWWVFPVAIVALIPVAVSLFKNGKRGWGWIVVGLIIVILLLLFWFVQQAAGRFGRSGAGGLGGFGGGFSGGGGATGSW